MAANITKRVISWDAPGGSSGTHLPTTIDRVTGAIHRDLCTPQGGAPEGMTMNVTRRKEILVGQQRPAGVVCEARRNRWTRLMGLVLGLFFANAHEVRLAD